MKNTLIVPSNRPEQIDSFLSKWQPKFNDIMVVGTIDKESDNQVKFFTKKHITEELKDKSFIISLNDSAIKNYGIMKAYKQGSQNLFLIDDDCLPLPEYDHIKEHIRNLYNTPKWSTITSNITPRGTPYFNKGKLNNVVLNIGLWNGIPDLDAPKSLILGIQNYVASKKNGILNPYQCYALSGMNICFKREIAVLMYFAPNSDKFARFDDIWCMLIVQAICKHLKMAISYGQPIVSHNKMSNLFDNLIKESNGIEFNETFWAIINSIEFKGKIPKECMLEVGEYFSKIKNDYIKNYGQSILTWCTFFD